MASNVSEYSPSEGNSGDPDLMSHLTAFNLGLG